MRVTKTHFFLLLIVLLAVMLRLIAAARVDVGTDEMIYSLLPLDIISAGRLGTVEQSPLYFYLTDIGYTITGGISPLAIRLPSIVFGSLAVIIIYLLGKELFDNKKAALLAAFLVAVSGYTLQYNIEMDMTAYFFVLVSILFFYRALKKNIKNIYYAALFFGLAIAIKNTVFLIAPAYVITFLIWYKKQEQDLKSLVKPIILSFLLFFITLIPIFAYNYLTYTSKGITDYYFSNMLGIGETVHQGMAAKTWAAARLWTVTKDLFLKLLRWDALTLFGGIIGTLLLFRTKETPRQTKYALFLLIFSLLTILLYLGGQTGSSSHYLWLPLVLSLPAGYVLSLLSDRGKNHFKHIIPLIISVALIINIIFFTGIFSRYNQQASTFPLWHFMHENTPKESLIIIDPKIYRGVYSWALNDRHYLEGLYLPQLEKFIPPNSPSVAIPLYYLECGDGSYCGWKPEDFENIRPVAEEVSKTLIPNMKKIAALKTEHTFNVYQGTIPIPSTVLDAVDQTHIFWFYPIGWKGNNFIDDYHAQGLNKIIEILGFIILYLELLIALLTIPFTISLIIKDTEETKYDH